MPKLKTIGDRLAFARTKGGISARELDRLAGKTEGHASLIEARRAADVLASNVAAYASVLGVTVEWLLTGEGDEPTEESVTAAVDPRPRVRRPSSHSPAA
jgi:transcriptional regulator with XRE-family HTH domain